MPCGIIEFHFASLNTFRQHFTACSRVIPTALELQCVTAPRTDQDMTLQLFSRSLSDCGVTDEDVDGGDLASCLDNAGRELVVGL